MALVSTFELLVKRIAPLTPSTPVNAAFRRVVQGYFLTIANPNEFSVELVVRATIPTWVGMPPSPDPQNARELVSGNQFTRNHIYTYDITGGVNNGQVIYDDMFGSIKCDGNAKLFSTTVLKLPACQTAAVKILPDIASPAINLANPRLEIRGFIEIFRLPLFPFPIRPVDLILTPEIRGTFLDNDYPDFCGGKGLDFDQIAYSLPLVDGSARVKVGGLQIGNSEIGFPYNLFSTEVEQIELDTRRDFAGKIILGDQSLQYFERLINIEKEINPSFEFDLSSFREYVEFELNNTYNIEE